MNELNNLVIQEARPLPVIILADVSGSMNQDGKINILNNSIQEMIDSLKDESSLRAEIMMAIITFGHEGAKLSQNFEKPGNINWKNVKASGPTPMGSAFKIIKEMMEDKSVIPSRSYAPTIILLSDGVPTDDWQNPLEALLTSPRASKSFRFSMSMGAGEDGRKVLKKFLGDSPLDVFESNQARDIKKFFKFVTMSVSQRVQSVNPNQPETVDYEDMEDDFEDFELSLED